MARRRKSAVIEPPAGLAAAQAMLAEIGAIDRAIKTATDACEDAVTKAKQARDTVVGPLEERADALFRALQAYVEANAAELFPHKRKSADWPTGTVGLRMTPPAVTIRRGDAESVLNTLLERLPQFVKVTAAMDRQALIRARNELPEIDGLSITQRREFFAKPTDSETERHRAVPKATVAS